MFIAAALLIQGPSRPVGHLVVAGGGPLPTEVFTRSLALAAGPTARILVIPQASRRPDAGQLAAEKWRAAGARNVVILDPNDQAIALKEVRQADLIWLCGGKQRRLMDALRRDGLVRGIRERYRGGATVGGTSAGAAVMSRIMITSAVQANHLGADMRPAGRGLGLWPDAIVDMHFLRRKRFNRLCGSVLGHPAKVGVGIDESTAVVVTGRSFEVIGKSNVLVIDARQAAEAPAQGSKLEAARGVVLSVLKPGMRFDLDSMSLRGSTAD